MSEEIRYYEGVGRRKRAVARVRLYPGKGEVCRLGDVSSGIDQCSVEIKQEQSAGVRRAQ